MTLSCSYLGGAIGFFLVPLLCWNNASSTRTRQTRWVFVWKHDCNTRGTSSCLTTDFAVVTGAHNLHHHHHHRDSSYIYIVQCVLFSAYDLMLLFIFIRNQGKWRCESNLGNHALRRHFSDYNHEWRRQWHMQPAQWCCVLVGSFVWGNKYNDPFVESAGSNGGCAATNGMTINFRLTTLLSPQLSIAMVSLGSYKTEADEGI